MASLGRGGARTPARRGAWGCRTSRPAHTLPRPRLSARPHHEQHGVCGACTEGRLPSFRERTSETSHALPFSNGEARRLATWRAHVEDGGGGRGIAGAGTAGWEPVLREKGGGATAGWEPVLREKGGGATRPLGRSEPLAPSPSGTRERPGPWRAGRSPGRC